MSYRETKAQAARARVNDMKNHVSFIGSHTSL
jgi:hypothetical protein